jgi:hypothetical protein
MQCSLTPLFEGMQSFETPPEYRTFLETRKNYSGGEFDSRLCFLRYGVVQDFLKYLFNEHLLLQCFMGEPAQRFNPQKRRICLWCTQTLAFFFACTFYSFPQYRLMLNIFVGTPILLILNSYIYYMLVCPCLQTNSTHDEEARRRSVIRYLCYCMQFVGVIATS